MAPTPIRRLLSYPGYVIAARDDGNAASSVTDIWVTLGIIIAIVAVSSLIILVVVLVLNRRRKNKTKLPYAIKNPREWYRRHNSVKEILEDEELERITQIRKSLQGRTSSRNSQSSNTTAATETTIMSDQTFDFGFEERTEVQRDDAKDWEHRLSTSPTTSVRDLEAQGHPAFSPKLPFPELTRAATEGNGTRFPERKRTEMPRRNTVGSPQPPSPARMADRQARRTRSRPSLPPGYERV